MLLQNVQTNDKPTPTVPSGKNPYGYISKHRDWRSIIFPGQVVRDESFTFLWTSPAPTRVSTNRQAAAILTPYGGGHVPHNLNFSNRERRSRFSGRGVRQCACQEQSHSLHNTSPPKIIQTECPVAARSIHPWRHRLTSLSENRRLMHLITRADTEKPFKK